MDETLDTPTPAPSDDLGTAAARLASLMGDDGNLSMPDDTGHEEEKPAEAKPDAAETTEVKAEEVKPPELVEVDIDGYKVQLPKDKAEALEKDRLRQADYTRKTMAAAEERKAAETAKTQASQERAEYAQRLQAITTTITAAVQSGQIKPPDAALLDSDPVSYLRGQAQWAQAQQAHAQAQAQLQQIQHQQRAEQDAQRNALLAAERDQLLAKVPEWKDETKAQAEKADLFKYLVDLGYTPQQIEETYDHRAMLAHLHAMRYSKLIAEQRAVIANKVPPAQPKAVKPGVAVETSKNPINQSAMQSLRKSGSLDDAKRAIASLLG